MLAPMKMNVQFHLALLLLGQRLDGVPRPCVAGVLHAVGHDQADDVVRAVVFGDRRQLVADLGDESARGVEQSEVPPRGFTTKSGTSAIGVPA